MPPAEKVSNPLYCVRIQGVGKEREVRNPSYCAIVAPADENSPRGVHTFSEASGASHPPKAPLSESIPAPNDDDNDDDDDDDQRDSRNPPV